MSKKIISTIIVTMLITAMITSAIAIFVIFPKLENDNNVTSDVIVDPEPEAEINEAVIDENVEADDEGLVKVQEDDYEYLLSLYNKYKKLEALEEYIRENYYLDVTEVDFMSEITKGLFEALDDPYSQYFTADEFKSYNEVASGSYEGIGVVVSPGEDGFITVVSPIQDSPGFEAGLKTNDKILKVDGIEYFADELEEAVMNIRGPAETTVILTVRREEEIIDIPVVRRQIKLEAVNSEVVENNIGLIEMFSFDQDSAAEFEEHLNKILDENVDGIIIDLRNNGGGYLSQCLKITDSLIGEGVIVKTKDNAGNVDIEYSDADKVDLPIVIIVNGGSASASEILTGAVKDNEEGIIVGTTTFGKGLVQTMLPLPSFDNSGFKLTIKQYYTPDDYYIHGVGIEPDITIENDEETETDEQFDKAMEVILEEIK